MSRESCRVDGAARATSASERGGAAGGAREARAPALSVAIVCKDNEGTIGRTLESVRGLAGAGEGGGGALEIVAVDSGSRDGTIGVLERHGARVIRHEWLGHVKTKQMALEACAGAWVLCLDSDESLLPDLRGSIERALESSSARDAASGVNGFEINRKTYYRGRALEHAWQPEWRLRLVRRGCARWGGMDPHDKLELTGGRTERLRGDLRHDSFETFSDHLRKQWGHASTMARSMHERGIRTSKVAMMVSPVAAFVKQLIVKGGMLDGTAGWLAAASAASAALTKHAVLLELEALGNNEGRGEAGGMGRGPARDPALGARA